MAVLRFGDLFSLSWKRLLQKKKQLIIPAIFGGGLQSCNFNGGGGGSDFPVENTDTVEPLSLIPRALAQESFDSVSQTMPFAIVALLITLGIVVAVIVYVANIYSLHVIFDEHKSFKQTLKQCFKVFFPLIGVSIWVLIRSYVWIPTLTLLSSGIWLGWTYYATDLWSPVGIAVAVVSFLALLVLSLYFYPRMQFATILYIKRKAGIKNSVEQSLQKTTGYWRKIVGNSILFGFCQLGIILAVVFCVVFSAILVGILGAIFYEKAALAITILGITAAVILVIAVYFGVQYLTFWSKCFQYELWLTISGNPRPAKKELR